MRVKRFCALLLGWLACTPGMGLYAGAASPAEALFQAGNNAYRAGRHLEAAEAYTQSAMMRPAAGTLLNLGLAEWRLGRSGEAILSWERAHWLNPYHSAARQNLEFARRIAQVDSPDLAWYEVVSAWLPVNWWTLLAGISLWGSVGLALAPAILRSRKAAWQQAVAAFGLMFFLLTIPAQYGVNTRSRIGFVLRKDAPLRLSPTKQAQAISWLAAGQPARLKKIRGDFLLVQSGHSLGWLTRNEFGLLCPLAEGRSHQSTITVGRIGNRPHPAP